MFEYGKVPAKLGEIPHEKLEAWANRRPRFVQLMSEDAMFEKAYSEVLEMAREEGVPEIYIDWMTMEKFKESIRADLTIIFVCDFTQEYFGGKAEQEALKDTIESEEWISKAIELAKEWSVSSMASAAQKAERMKEHMARVSGCF